MQLRLTCVPLALLAACNSTGGAPAPPADVLTQHIYIEADYDSVWEHWTRAEAFAGWYTVPCQQFGSRPGDELVWGTTEREVYRGRLLHMEKGRGLSWEFRFVGFDFAEPMTPVDIEIVERGPTVLVSVSHDVTGAPAISAMISGVGWAKPLSRLKTLLETGQSMPWPVEPR